MYLKILNLFILAIIRFFKYKITFNFFFNIKIKKDKNLIKILEYSITGNRSRLHHFL
jgi:hypothetical protein